MRFGTRWTGMLAAMGLLAAGCGTTQAAMHYTPPKFPKGNALVGAKIFSQTCATCHGVHATGTPGLAPPLRPPSQFAWQLYGTPNKLAEFIYQYMPKTNPGSLSRQQAADLAALVWSVNGLSGKKTERASLAALGAPPPTTVTHVKAHPKPHHSSHPSHPQKAPKPQAAYTAAEVAAGAKLYASTCATCHGTNGQADTALGRKYHAFILWGPKSVIPSSLNTMSALSAFIHSSMPFTNPGSLTAAQATDAAAYILHQNGIK